MEKQQFHQEQLKLAEMRARASHVTGASPSSSEGAQPHVPQVSTASGSPQPVQPVPNQPARVPTPGTQASLTSGITPFFRVLFV